MLHSYNARHQVERCMFLVVALCGFDYGGILNPREFEPIGLGKWNSASFSNQKPSLLFWGDLAVLVSHSVWM